MQKNAINHEKLFVGEDLAVDYHGGGFPISIVTFEARNKYISAVEPSPFENGYGRGIFAQLGLNEFLVKRSRNHWYQTDEIEEVIRLIKDRAKGTTVITYGGSMGGMAAISLAPKLGAKYFIALSPLYDIAEGGEVDDDRWGDEGQILDFTHNYIGTGECKDSKGYVFYCPDTIDVEHARCIERMTAGTMVPLEYGGHPVSFFLNDTYKLKRLVSEIAHEEFNVDQFREVVKTQTALTHYPYESQAAVLNREGYLTEAINSLRTAVTLNTKLARLPYKLGELLFKAENYDEAETAFEQALSREPALAKAHVRLSQIFENQGRISDAIRAIRRAIKISPSKADFHLRLGVLLLQADRAKEAQASISRAIKIDPKVSAAHVRLSYAYAAQEHWVDAIDAMKQALVIAPDRAEYHLRLGEWQLQAEDFVGAEKSVQQAITLAPDNSHYLVRLSYVFAAQDDYERSASAMERAVELAPKTSAFHLRLGECLVKAGNLDAAQTSMREAVRLAPKHQRSKKRLVAVQAAVAKKKLAVTS